MRYNDILITALNLGRYFSKLVQNHSISNMRCCHVND